jgi:PAS domain S-box-containing protein
MQSDEISLAGRPHYILVIGGADEEREGYVRILVEAGLTADGRAGLVEETEGADLILIAGGVPGSKREGFGAVIDAVAATRNVAGQAAVVACVPREAGGDAIQAAIDSGADDVVLVPAAPGVLPGRARAACVLGAARVEFERAGKYGDALVAIGAHGELSLDNQEAVHDILTRLNEAIGWARAALILSGDDLKTATLVAASDDPAPMKIPVQLDRYPELQAAIETREPILIDDSQSSHLLGEWGPVAAAADKGGRTLLAVPLVVERRPVGALLFRHTTPSAPLPIRAIDFLRLAALTLGLVLRAGRVFEALREQTRRMSMVRYSEERRNRAIDQVRDFFESSPDGVVVVDGEAQVVFLNRAAQQMTGYALEGLGGRDFTEIVAQPHRAALREVISQVASGVQLESFDLSLSTTSGETLTTSVSASPALAEHGCAVLSFRDVTERRLLEGELRKTGDFLERLIDSAVDGIIAADMRGQVMIFNQGASRIYGYAPEEIIGKMSVRKLYPEGVASAIMSELRSGEYGGVGRLEPSRRDIVTKEGGLVPVTLTASIIYEDGREVATVGLFSDLRDRLRIEQRLQAAQDKLVITEKQALIAELAGTTAHELNQPLTSVMGYAELLRKKMSPDDANFRAIDIILREAERMAEIVRKIGRITKYETKTYVGSTTILDLDKSAGSGGQT